MLANLWAMAPTPHDLFESRQKYSNPNCGVGGRPANQGRLRAFKRRSRPSLT